MAEETELSVEEPKKSKLPLIIAAVVTLLVAASAGGYYWLSQAKSGNEQSAEPVESEVIPAEYISIPKAFVFNVPDGGRDRLVKIKVQLVVRGKSAVKEVRKHLPSVRSTLLDGFLASNGGHLRNSKGQQQLRQQALESLQQTLTELSGEAFVEKVLFTDFVLQ